MVGRRHSEKLIKYRFLGTQKHTHFYGNTPFGHMKKLKIHLKRSFTMGEFISKVMKSGRKIQVKRALLLDSIDLSLDPPAATFWLNCHDLQSYRKDGL